MLQDETENRGKSDVIVKYGDIIQLYAPRNYILHDKIFYVNKIDHQEIEIVNVEMKCTLPLLEKNQLADTSILRLSILSTNERDMGYALQNNLKNNTLIEIEFDFLFPNIIGEITDVQNDQIEVSIKNDLENTKDTIYIDFEYKGLHDNLHIKNIKIIENEIVQYEMKTVEEELTRLYNQCTLFDDQRHRDTIESMESSVVPSTYCESTFLFIKEDETSLYPLVTEIMKGNYPLWVLPILSSVVQSKKSHHFIETEYHVIENNEIKRYSNNDEIVIKSFAFLTKFAMFAKIKLSNMNIMTRVGRNNTYLTMFQVTIPNKGVISPYQFLKKNQCYTDIQKIPTIDEFIKITPHHLLKKNYSFVEFVNTLLEPFMIRTKNIQYGNEYKNIIIILTALIDDYIHNIHKNKKQLLLRKEKVTSYQRNSFSELFNDSLLQKCYDQFLGDEDETKMKTSTELLTQIVHYDQGTFFHETISSKNSHLIVNPFFVEEVLLNTKNNSIPKIVKVYSSTHELEKDNGHSVFYDTQYDDTPYTTYPLDDIVTLDNETKKKILKVRLRENGITTDLDELIQTLVMNKKLVQNNEYAMLSTTKEYFKRQNHEWKLDSTMNEEKFLNNRILYDTIRDKKLKLWDFEHRNVYINEFKDRLDQMDRTLQLSTAKQLEKQFYLSTKQRIIATIQEQKQNNICYELGRHSNTVIHTSSPWNPLLLTLLSNPRQQKKINNFITNYTRHSILEKEDPYWYYCKDTNHPLLPTFLYGKEVQVEDSFIEDDEIFDIHSGYSIKKVELSISKEDDFSEISFDNVFSIDHSKDDFTKLYEIIYKQLRIHVKNENEFRRLIKKKMNFTNSSPDLLTFLHTNSKIDSTELSLISILSFILVFIGNTMMIYTDQIYRLHSVPWTISKSTFYEMVHKMINILLCDNNNNITLFYLPKKEQTLKLKKDTIQNITSEFRREFLKELSLGHKNQRQYIGTIKNKISIYTNAIIEGIDEKEQIWIPSNMSNVSFLPSKVDGDIHYAHALNDCYQLLDYISQLSLPSLLYVNVKLSPSDIPSPEFSIIQREGNPDMKHLQFRDNIYEAFIFYLQYDTIYSVPKPFQSTFCKPLHYDSGLESFEKIELLQEGRYNIDELEIILKRQFRKRKQDISINYSLYDGDFELKEFIETSLEKNTMWGNSRILFQQLLPYMKVTREDPNDIFHFFDVSLPTVPSLLPTEKWLIHNIQEYGKKNNDYKITSYMKELFDWKHHDVDKLHFIKQMIRNFYHCLEICDVKLYGESFPLLRPLVVDSKETMLDEIYQSEDSLDFSLLCSDVTFHEKVDILLFVDKIPLSTRSIISNISGLLFTYIFFFILDKYNHNVCNHHKLYVFFEQQISLKHLLLETSVL